MIRVILFLAAILALATGLSWLADQPGNVRIEGQGWVIETSLFRAVVLAALAIGTALVTWSLIRHLWHSPAAVGNVMNRRRNKQGMQALSAGMIAVGSGDRAGATRHALMARKALPNEPMTHLLRAQAAQLAGDKVTARRIYEAMLSSPDTEPLGLRGLFLEAEREKETEAARQFAERALRLNPKLLWASDALFDIQCRSSDWSGALETLVTARKNGLVEKPVADRRRAVLLAAQAGKAEDTEPDRALNLAIEAHNLAPDLVPAAAQAARMLASRGNTPKAAKIVERAWAKSPHPDLATVYAYARVGDSPRDRLTRIKRLASQNPYSPESAIAVANAAIDAREFDDAREALKPMLDGNLTQRIATLMARIESEQFGDKGRVREWLARAVNASRDPAWTADGIVSDDWSPISPVTGQLDAVQWKVPVERLAARDGDVLAHRIEELVALGAPPAIEAVRDDVETIEAEPIPSRFAAGSAARPAQSEPSAVRSQGGQPAGRQPDRSDIGATSAMGKATATTDKEQPAKDQRATAAAASVPPSAEPGKSSIPSAASAIRGAVEGKPVLSAMPSSRDADVQSRESGTSATAGSATAAANDSTLGHNALGQSTLGRSTLGQGAANSAASVPTGTKTTAPNTSSKPDNGTTKSAHASGAPASTKPVPAQLDKAPATTPPITAKPTALASDGRTSADGTNNAALIKAPAVSEPVTQLDTSAALRDPQVRPETAAKEPPANATQPAKEPRIFVVPHAPDDPGPDGSDDVVSKGNRPPYRALP